jgi:hypothetical protein
MYVIKNVKPGKGTDSEKKMKDNTELAVTSKDTIPTQDGRAKGKKER